MSAKELIVMVIMSCLYFELAFFFIPQIWMRAALFLALCSAYVFYRHNSFDRKLEGLSALIKDIINGNYFSQPHHNKYNGILQDIYLGLAELKNKFLKDVFELEVAASQISSASGQLNVTLHENKCSTQELYAQTEEICALNNTSYNNITSTISEIKRIFELLDKVRDTSHQMEESGNISKGIIAESLQDILDIVDSIKDIQHSVDNTVICMDRLSSTTQEIAYILETVDNIAKQTHLLSLNANIEASRAGIHGKGFGVVAEEIGKLSRSSKDSVSEIAALLNSITSEVTGIRERITDNIGHVNKSVSCSQKVESSLSRIEQSYDNVQSMIQSVINSSENANELASKIKNKIDSVEAISQQVSAGFDLVYKSVNRQKDNIEELGSLSACMSNAAAGLSALIEKTDINLMESCSHKFSDTTQRIIDLIKENLLTTDGILSMEQETHKILLDEALNQNEFLEAIWTNDLKGRFVYSNPPAGIANAKVREWFQESLSGKEFVSAAYISAITRNPCITVSLPIKNHSGEQIGVIGADVNVSI